MCMRPAPGSNAATAICCWWISCNPRLARPCRRSAKPLGSWRLTGEICDGKCSLGVMRPGNKAAHKACANVCLIGGVPPVFITTTPVLGTQYLLMGDPQNHALPDALRDYVAITSGWMAHWNGSVTHWCSTPTSPKRSCHDVALDGDARGGVRGGWNTVEYSPVLLDWLGLCEFVFLGQLGLPILVLSVSGHAVPADFRAVRTAVHSLRFGLPAFENSV